MRRQSARRRSGRPCALLPSRARLPRQVQPSSARATFSFDNVPQHINALRGQLAGYGLVAAKGPSNLPRLVALIADAARWLPQPAKAMLDVLLEMISILDERVKQLDREIAQRAKTEDIPKRLMTIPGIGPITATAIAALAPPAETF